jgi:hypothetical protein
MLSKKDAFIFHFHFHFHFHLKAISRFSQRINYTNMDGKRLELSSKQKLARIKNRGAHSLFSFKNFLL